MAAKFIPKCKILNLLILTQGQIYNTQPNFQKGYMCNIVTISTKLKFPKKGKLQFWHRPTPF